MVVTGAQKKFIARYIENDFRNATAAYQAAYPEASYDTARANATKLLAKTSIQEYLSAAVAEALGREKLTLEKRLFDYWMKRAFYDVTKIVDLNGNLVITEAELRKRGLDACIDSVNKKIDAQGNTIVTYKFADRDGAAGMLQKYIQMIREKIDVNHSISPESRDFLKSVFASDPPPEAAP